LPFEKNLFCPLKILKKSVLKNSFSA